jgi:hypothetical protein
MKHDDTGSGCSALVLLVLLGVTIGSRCFDYSLYSIFGKGVPWYADCVAGTVLGSPCIPVAVICWIIRLCGVEAPFVGQG